MKETKNKVKRNERIRIKVKHEKKEIVKIRKKRY